MSEQIEYQYQPNVVPIEKMFREKKTRQTSSKKIKLLEEDSGQHAPKSAFDDEPEEKDDKLTKDTPAESNIFDDDFDTNSKVFILVSTTMIFLTFVGGIFAAVYLVGVFDDDFQTNLLFYVVIPLLFTTILCILPVMIMQGHITRDFIANVSRTEGALKAAVQSSATNVSLVSALVATIAIPLMYVDPPQDTEVERVYWFYWYYALASIAASCSFAGMIMGLLVLMYTDPLSNESVAVFIRNFKGVVGLPFALLSCSCIFLMGSFATYTMYAMNALFFICHTTEFFGVMFCVGLFQIFCSMYVNETDSLNEYEKNLLGFDETTAYNNDNKKEKKPKNTSEYLASLTSEQLFSLMKKDAVLRVRAADVFKKQEICGAMLHNLSYDIVKDILEWNKDDDNSEQNKGVTPVTIGQVINVCHKLGIAIDK